MSIRAKKLILVLALLLFSFFIAKRLTHQKQSLPEERKKELPLSGQMQPYNQTYIAPDTDAIEIDSVAKPFNEANEAARPAPQPKSEWRCPAGTIMPEFTDIKRKRAWDEVLKSINSELSRSKDWFDSVNVLSTWLYQNIRTGDVTKNNIDRVIGKTYVLKHIDLEYLYNVNNSDSVAGACGFHGYYAVLFYKHFGIKSYCYSMRPNRKRKIPEEVPRFATIAVGHMINILQNPHNKKWYPVDNFFGIRYRHDGEWLDMQKYFQLAREHSLGEVSVETFGTYKLLIHDSPCIPFTAWGLDTSEIISAERGNSSKYFRIVAPYRLKQQFTPQFKEMFDQIALTYEQPPHDDLADLARRMPLYVARMFPLLDLNEQIHADSLLNSWRQ